MSKKYDKITDEEVTGLINDAISQSVGSYADGSDLSEAREEAINYYTQQPKGRLAPMGVSKVVTSDTVEIVVGMNTLLKPTLSFERRSE